MGRDGIGGGVVTKSEIGDEIIQRSDLYERARELGATFSIFHGWEMPEMYSDPLQEHAAVRSCAGLIDLSYLGSIKVYGGEATQFLNGLVTNNVKTLEVGKGMRAAILTGHGKVKALCRVLDLGGAYLVITDPQTHESVFKYLFPFSYAGDFKVEDVSEEYRTVSVQGPKSHLVMKEICFEPVPSLSEYDLFQTLIAGHRALVTKTTHTGEVGFDILVPGSAIKDVWDFILLKGSFHAIVPFGLRALESLRIEAGIPVYGRDVDETNMMLETGLEDAVSFTKGCYTGQEAVAMATYRGHVSKKLTGLALSGEVVPHQGDRVRKEGKEIGFVTSAMRSPTLGSVIALGYVKHGFFELGNSVEIQSGAEAIPAIVVHLPFYAAA
jgi:glycine cleavage system T protein (aminomethyltransferase)